MRIKYKIVPKKEPIIGPTIGIQKKYSPCVNVVDPHPAKKLKNLGARSRAGLMAYPQLYANDIPMTVTLNKFNNNQINISNISE